MNIRQALPVDSLLLSSLCMDVQRLHAENHSDVFKMPGSEDFAVSFFDEVLAEPAATIFIAEENKDAIGYVLCRLIERPETSFTFGARTLHIDQISVRPAARGQGVGAALIQQAELLAKQLNVQRIQLDSWDFNLNAHTFFERLGFEKYNLRFWRKL
jgi:ribosomal protein S18 acetylase RimI-like enzyme